MLEYCRGTNNFSWAIELDGFHCHICCLQTEKCNEKEKAPLKKWIRVLSIIAIISARSLCQMQATAEVISPGIDFLRTKSTFRKRKKIVIACLSPLSNVKLGILTSLLAHCDGKNEQKKFWTTSVELLFSLFNLLLSPRSRCRCPRSIIGPFYMARGGGGGWVGWGNPPDNIMSHFNLIIYMIGGVIIWEFIRTSGLPHKAGYLTYLRSLTSK